MHQFRLYLSLILLASVLLTDVYTWHGLKHLSRRWTHKTQAWFRFAFWQLTIVFIACVFYTVHVQDISLTFRNTATALFVIVYLSKLVFTLVLAVDDLRRLAVWLRNKVQTSQPTPEVQNSISRKDFLVKSGLVAAGVPFVLLAKGAWNGGYSYRIHRRQIYLPRLPAAFRGLRVLQLSDIHSGSWSDADAVARGIRMAMQLKPDVIFFTGDLVNNRTPEVYPWMDVLSRLQAPMGVLSILGNHDYGDYVPWDSPMAKEANLHALKTVHLELGWHLMLNSHVTMDRHGQRIGIVGVENWGDRGRFQKFGNLEQATTAMPDVPVKLLLSHDPSHWDAKVRNETPDIDLTLSGHTHGFQFGVETDWVRWSPSQYLYRQWAGHYQAGRQQLYVNRGFGFLGFPGRVGILPEITLLELV